MDGYINEPITLSCRLDDGITTLYPQVKIYDKDGTLITTKNLSHLSNGIYTDSTWEPNEQGIYTADYTIYSDAGYTSKDINYNQCTESIFVTSISSQVGAISSQIHGIGFTTMLTDIQWISSQQKGISSQVYNLSGNLPLGQWHGTGDWGAAASTDLSSILEELDFISSQLFWASGVQYNISTQLRGVSSQVAGTGIGLTPAQVWEYGTRTLTSTDTNPEVSYISSQMQYISSQITHISSNVEMYGGGGGSSAPAKSYVAYTSKQSPWKFREKESIIKDVKAILETVSTLETKTEEYHQDQVKGLMKTESNIINSIDKALINLEQLKKRLQEVDSNDVKLLSSVDSSIENLTMYKLDVEKRFKGLEDYLFDIMKMVSKSIPIEGLEQLEVNNEE